MAARYSDPHVHRNIEGLIDERFAYVKARVGVSTRMGKTLGGVDAIMLF